MTTIHDYVGNLLSLPTVRVRKRIGYIPPRLTEQDKSNIGFCLLHSRHLSEHELEMVIEIRDSKTASGWHLEELERITGNVREKVPGQPPARKRKRKRLNDRPAYQLHTVEGPFGRNITIFPSRYSGDIFFCLENHMMLSIRDRDFCMEIACRTSLSNWQGWKLMKIVRSILNGKDKSSGTLNDI